MEKILMSNRFDLGSIITGVVASQFFADAFEKIVLTTFSMVIGTTFAYFWRRFLHKKMRQKLKDKKKVINTDLENNINDLTNID